MKKIITKIWSRFLINQIKKGAVNNESVLRILIHFTLLRMQEMEQDSIEIEYEAPEKTDVKLILLAYLTDRK